MNSLKGKKQQNLDSNITTAPNNNIDRYRNFIFYIAI